MTGYLFQPPIIGFEEDDTWGNVHGIRYPIIDGNFIVTKGRILKDEILVRVENQYWKWTIYDFKTKALFFAIKAIGEWYVQKNEIGTIDVKYIYTYYSKNIFTHPINWLFIKIQVRGLMRKAIKAIKEQAESNCEFIYQN